jgi:proteasome lid subunit RPN8/RPN11
MVAHAYDGLPNEACGLLGFRGDIGERFAPLRNADASSRTFRFDDREYAAVDDDLAGDGLVSRGIVHSHTHTEAYPSPTDIGMAAPWNVWFIVSLRQPEPVVRAYVVTDDSVVEEQISLLHG